MWTRAELKTRAKAALKGRYWESVAACLIVMAISVAASFVITLIPVINFFGSLAIVFFGILPLTVGLAFFMMQNRLGPPYLQNIFFAFYGSRYMKIVGAMAWQYLFVYVWSLIPSRAD
jgi:uncharacterized membrane protein